MARIPTYEADPETFSAPAYVVKGWRGVAFHVLGWEVEPDEDSVWTGIYPRTGKVLCVMVGDDRRHSEDPDDLTPIGEDDFCPGCGQTGCHCYR